MTHRDRDLIRLHLEAEARLHRLRLMRLMNHPGYRPEDEDAAVDEMERLWWEMSSAERSALADARPAEASTGSARLPSLR
jgi:hypothetical protein